MNLTSLREIRPILEKNGFNFSKSLGQNFLINEAVPEKIAEISPCSDKSLAIEIGTGVGCLTKELAKRNKKVTAIELDSRLLPVLDETLAEFDNIRIINDDILKVDLRAVIEEEGLDDVFVCGNLPYYITTPIIMKLLEDRLPIKSITVMVQKEVAERFAAKPGTKNYGAITAAINYYAKITDSFSVSSGNFFPKPKVDSAVIRLDLIPPPVSFKDEKLFFGVLRAAFAMRRKTLVNNLQSAFSLPKETLAKMLEDMGYVSTVRGETLGISDFAKISDGIFDLKNK